jgi:ribonucleotide reductase class II
MLRSPAYKKKPKGEKMQSTSSSLKAPLGPIQLYGAYSRIKLNGQLENWRDICDRYLHHPTSGLFEIGDYTKEEETLIEKLLWAEGQISKVQVFGSMRALWSVTDWSAIPENYPAMFNCESRDIDSIESICSQVELAMLGVGTGCVLTREHISKIPPIKRSISIEIKSQPGEVEKENRCEHTEFKIDYPNKRIYLFVGDSRKGWVKAYQLILEAATIGNLPPEMTIVIYLGNVRPTGERVMGFGGTANPEKLGKSFKMVGQVLAGAVDRQLTSVELCLIIDWASECIQSGGIRRVAGMRQFSADDLAAATAKSGLWKQDESGAWKIDLSREAMRVANHTRVFSRKPSYEECLKSVQTQFFSGEGAIQWAGEAVARASADLLPRGSRERQIFLKRFNSAKEEAKLWMMRRFKLSEVEAEERLGRFGLNPCGEAVLRNNFCNLSSVHLGNIDPMNWKEQRQAFRVAALHASGLLNRNFTEPIFKQSRDNDPIVIVSFTEAIDFFARAFGLSWFKWWKRDRLSNAWEIVEGKDRERIEAVCTLLGVSISDYEIETKPRQQLGRKIQPPEKYLNLGIFQTLERIYLEYWREVVKKTVWDYCDRHQLKRPNRCTGLKPEGSGTLLTGVGCCGIHLPKAWWVIRRRECRAGDPKALAAMAFGYSVLPASSEKDENGILLNDPHDPRVKQWVVEVPCQEPLVSTFPELEELDEFDPNQFSAESQFKWFMQVQKYFSEHNTSYTLEFRESEIESLAKNIHQAIEKDEGFISLALLARSDAHETFPRLPFQPVTRQEYERLMAEVLERRQFETYEEALKQFCGEFTDAAPPSCDSAVCEF